MPSQKTTEMLFEYDETLLRYTEYVFESGRVHHVVSWLNDLERRRRRAYVWVAASGNLGVSVYKPNPDFNSIRTGDTKGFWNDCGSWPTLELAGDALCRWVVYGDEDVYSGYKSPLRKAVSTL